MWQYNNYRMIIVNEIDDTSSCASCMLASLCRWEVQNSINMNQARQRSILIFKNLSVWVQNLINYKWSMESCNYYPGFWGLISSSAKMGIIIGCRPWRCLKDKGKWSTCSVKYSSTQWVTLLLLLIMMAVDGKNMSDKSHKCFPFAPERHGDVLCGERALFSASLRKLFSLCLLPSIFQVFYCCCFLQWKALGNVYLSWSLFSPLANTSIPSPFSAGPFCR